MISRSLILATRNRGKIIEFQELLSDFDLEIKGLEDFHPIPSPREEGETFAENAHEKAFFTAKHLGSPALADDSGLMVEALYGAPGVRSARYAGKDASDLDRNRKLLGAMEGARNRRAAFACAIAIVLPEGPSCIYEGKCAGEIAFQMKGKNGFGYDPLFYYPTLKKTFAQMSSEEKNKVSHRGKAMGELRADFPRVLEWLQRSSLNPPGSGFPAQGEDPRTS